MREIAFSLKSPDRCRKDPGFTTSDIRRSGDLALAATSAASGEVKNFVEWTW